MGIIKNILNRHKANEPILTPNDGIFWLIGNELVSFADPIDKVGRITTPKEHDKIWETIKSKYKICNKLVNYDYFPRGRVVIHTVSNYDGSFSHYNAYIYIDDCIKDDETISDIINSFCLKDCTIKYIGSDGDITSEHYDCHYCRIVNH